MSKEKQTDFSTWKNKLSEMDSLPAESGNNSLLWGRLQERLEEKPRRKKMVWYWAAASLLLLITLPFLITKKASNHLPVKEIVQQKQYVFPGSTKITPQKENTVTISNLFPEKKPAGRYVAKKITRFSNHDMAIKIQQPVISTVILSPEIGAPSIHSNDTNTLLIAKAPPKVKLPVVNINELDASTEQIFTAQTKKHSDLRIKFGNEKTFGKPAETRQVIAGVSTIKIPFNN